MADFDASPPPNLRQRRAARQSNAHVHVHAPDRDSAPGVRHEKIESGADSSFLGPLTPDSGLSPEPAAQRSPGQDGTRDDDDDSKRRSKAQSRTHKKHRSSGGFLLSDPVANDRTHDAYPRTRSQRRHRDAVENHTAEAGQRDQDMLHPDWSRTEGLGLSLERAKPGNMVSSGSAVTKGESLAGETAVRSSSPTTLVPLDTDSAQIVKMALNLSESRRLASRRNVSQPIPPRLAPLPDAPTGGSLRQHLQQQRRVSRTISPKPDRSPRAGPARVLSPLQSTFESEEGYRYHFSPSTLSRAQKAKDYLELMAQYRRVLDLLPLLTPARSSTVSPPASPSDSVQVFRLPTNGAGRNIGRPYDPLQYIRNRKVRARERKVIDGESQGFNDTLKVSEWVDHVSRWVATDQARIPGNPALPPFAGADVVAVQGSPPSTSSRTVGTSVKPRRPRVDWVLDPADMLADIYWLEQDDNKKLVEDRHWRRVFPQDTDGHQSLSREDTGPRTNTPGSNKSSPEGRQVPEKSSSDHLPQKAEHEHVLSTARDRAQQKLRALRGAHHRHTGSMHNRDPPRIHRGSLSDSSDTDMDMRGRGRAGTISSTGKALLAKQVDEMIAREQASVGPQPQHDDDALRMKFIGAGLMTPDRERPQISPLPSRANSHRRGESLPEFSETDSKPPRPMPLPSSPPGPMRTSLEVPQRNRRFSVDYDTSQPNSPVLRPLRDGALVPAIGMDLSPMSSRPSSPTRNPLTKVRSIFRERSKDRLPDIRSPPGEDAFEFALSPIPLEKVESPGADWSGVPSDRIHSRSPPRKSTTGGTQNSHKSHKSRGSMKLRGEDGIGLRSLFRGPRIDSVLRTSVSRVSDLIWRKEPGGGGDENFFNTSSDDSDLDRVMRGRSRGRSKGSVLPSRTGSRYGRGGDAASQLLSPPGETTLSAPGSYPASRPISRRSSRFDLLKPPRIDIQNASPTTGSPPSELAQPPDLDEATESESRKSSYADAIRATDARLNAVLTLPKRTPLSPAMSSRHWAVTDSGGAPARAAVSKREVARVRTLLLSYGIQAMEIERRIKERKLLTSVPARSSLADTDGAARPTSENNGNSLPWSEVASLCPDPEIRMRLLTRPVAQTDLYPLAGRVLGASIQESAQQWQVASTAFTTETAPALQERVDALRNKVAGELASLTQTATEEADEANHDLVAGQRLKVKRVVDGMDKMLRRRRRRFRWVRRAGWLAVEWVLVGFMWYVWFVVMLARILLGIGKGFTRAVRWLLWL